MKRIVAIFLCLILMGTLALSATAAGSAHMSISSSAGTVYRGDSFTLTVSLSNDQPVSNGGIVLSYDSSVFELTGGSCNVSNATLAEVSAANGGGVFLLQSDAVVSGAIFTINMKVKGDAAIAMLSAGALAVGYLLLNIFPSSNTGSLSGDVCSSLFGSTSMMTLSPSDVWLCVILCAVVLGFFILCYHRVFAVTFDQRFATATGLSSRVYNFAIAAVSGVVIVMAMKLVGALLISALIIFPALSAMRVFRSFRSVMITAAVISVVGSLAGLALSLLFSTPTGATVVAVHMVIFGVFSLLKTILKR